MPGLDKNTYKAAVLSAFRTLWSADALATLNTDVLQALRSGTVLPDTLPTTPEGRAEMLDHAQKVVAASISSAVLRFVWGVGPHSLGACRLAFTTVADTNFETAAPQTVDNVVVAVGDRILVTGQSAIVQLQATGYKNGIYIVKIVGTGSNGKWIRADDMDVVPKVSLGDTAWVTEGLVGANSSWLVTSKPSTFVLADNPTGAFTFVAQVVTDALETLAGALANANDTFVKSGKVTTTFDGTVVGIQTTTGVGAPTGAPAVPVAVDGTIS